jgi:hypothetical protein
LFFIIHAIPPVSAAGIATSKEKEPGLAAAPALFLLIFSDTSPRRGPFRASPRR